jgi:2-methylcitrate dehydratase PrpD
MTLSQRLAEFAHRLDLDDVPAEVVAAARYCILDAIGIGLAASTFEFARRSTAGVVALAGDGEHAVIGSTTRLPARDAALLNGLLIHGLDYDDTHTASVVHASASAVPVMLAEGMRQRADGAHALAAYILAVETAARLGQHAGGWWQKVGFHPTGVVGVFGATLAAGYLQGASPAVLAHAQGLALSLASGSMEFLEDGAWTKRLHPGWAAASGITAATLAAHGFEAPQRAYEGRFGLFATYLGVHAPPPEVDPLATLGHQWETAQVAIKPYPVCHYNHACGDAALLLRERHAIDAAEVAAVTVRLHPNQFPVVCEPLAAKRRPQSEYDAKFSLPFFVAACLVRGRFTLEELEDASRRDPHILALCERIHYDVDPQTAFPQHFSGAIEIEIRDGRRFAHSERIQRGAAERPLTPDEIGRKFIDNAVRVLPLAQAERLRDAVLGIDRAPDLRELCAALVPP